MSTNTTVMFQYCFTALQTQTAEHTTLADLLEVVSSIRDYLGRVATVVIAVAERNGAQTCIYTGCYKA